MWAHGSGLNDNAYHASDRIACIQPLSGIKPTELQRNSSREQRAQMAQEQAEPDYFYRVHANPAATAGKTCIAASLYPRDNGRAKIGDILYIGTPEQCRELMDQLNTGELTQEAVKELYAKEQGATTPIQEPTTRNKNPCRAGNRPAREVTSDPEPQAPPPKTPDGVAEKGAGNR